MRITLKTHTAKLLVRRAQWDDRYTDTARINVNDRGGFAKSRVYRLSVEEGKPQFVYLRGIEDHGIITLDYDMRERLGVTPDMQYDFTLAEGRLRFLDEWIWAWKSSNPSYRIAAQISLLSLILGLLSLLLAFALR